MAGIAANTRAGSRDLSATAQALAAAPNNPHLSPLMRAYAGYGSDISLGSALPRDPRLLISQFGPGEPPLPFPVDSAGSSGRPLPRRTQFPIGFNLPTPPGATKLVPFGLLRTLADAYDILRRCIEVRKQEVATLDWEIAPIEEQQGEFRRMPGKKAGLFDQYRTERAELQKFWSMPDRINGHYFSEWIKIFLEEVFVYDTGSVYEHPTLSSKGGVLSSDLHSLEVLDGTTIKPLYDARGARPAPPYPAYQQYLFGIPRTDLIAVMAEYSDEPDMAAIMLDPDMQGIQRGFPGPHDDAAVTEFRSDQLAYRPYVQRTWSPYGFSNVEQIITNVNLALKRQQWHLAYFTDGDIPELLVHVPDTWPLDQILKYEQMWHATLSGDIGWKRRMRAVPGSLKADPMKDPSVHSMEFDEFLVRITCAGMDIDPTEVGFAPKSGLGGAGFMEGTAARTYRLTLRPLLTWLKEYQDDVISRRLRCPFLEFRYEELEVEDEQIAHKIDDQRLVHGTLSVNEYRVRRGETELDIPQAKEPMIILGREVVLLSDVGVASESTEQTALDTAAPGMKPPAKPAKESAPAADTQKVVSEEFDRLESFLSKSRSRPFDSDILPQRVVQEAHRLVNVQKITPKTAVAELRKKYADGLELTANEVAMALIEQMTSA